MLDFISKRLLVKKIGDGYFARCPFHKDTKQTLFIDTWNNQVSCPICDESWTKESFIARYERLTTYQSYIAINGLPEHNEDWKEQYRTIHKQMLIFKQYYKGSEADKYMQSRGIDDVVADHFDLGYAPSGFFKGRVIFPIKNLYGKYVGFTARSLNGEEPKYKNSANSPIFQKKRLLYGYESTHRYDAYVLVEGQMDVIKMQMLGYSNAVCSSGTAVNRDQLIGMKKVYICLDQDEAGKKATERVISISESIGVEYEVITFDGAKDPDEFISKGGDIYSKIPVIGYSEVIDTTKYNDILAGYAILDEDYVEASMVSKHWAKTMPDSVLRYYLSIIYKDYSRYKIEKELKFRRGGHNKDQVDVDELKKTIPIEHIIESYGVKIPSGRMNIACPLPDHKDTTPSFSINKSHNLFKCFGCNKGGSQIDFIMEMEKCDATNAIQKLISFL